jgi:hypothetical protein
MSAADLLRSIRRGSWTEFCAAISRLDAAQASPQTNRGWLKDILNTAVQDGKSLRGRLGIEPPKPFETALNRVADRPIKNPEEERVAIAMINALRQRGESRVMGINQNECCGNRNEPQWRSCTSPEVASDRRDETPLEGRQDFSILPTLRHRRQQPPALGKLTLGLRQHLEGDAPFGQSRRFVGCLPRGTDAEVSRI